MVTTIPAVLTPATGGFDPVPLRTPQKVGGHLRILQIGQKINDFSSWNQAIKGRFSVKIKRSRESAIGDQAIKVRKSGRSNFDPGRGCQYSRYSSDHPLPWLDLPSWSALVPEWTPPLSGGLLPISLALLGQPQRDSPARDVANGDMSILYSLYSTSVKYMAPCKHRLQ